MDRHQRLAMIEQLKEANERDRADLALRLARRLAGQESRSWTVPEPEPPRRSQPEPTTGELELLRCPQWQRYIDGRIDAALAPLREAVGTVVGQTRKQLRREIEAAVGSLRAELTVQLAHGVRDNGVVINLPAMPLRKRDAVHHRCGGDGADDGGGSLI